MVCRSAFLLLSVSCCGHIPRCVGSFLPTLIERSTLLRRPAAIVQESAVTSHKVPKERSTLLRRPAAIVQESAMTSHKVPKVIFSTFPDGLDISEWQKSVTMFAGGAMQRIFGDQEMAQLVGEIDGQLQKEVGLQGASQAFNLIRAGAWKADLWRYMTLWAYGGVYLDASVRLTQPIEAFVDWHSSDLTLVEDVDGNAYWNAMMASPPKHPDLLLAIKRVITNANKRFYGETCLDTTGPNMLYSVFSQQPKINQRFRVNFKLVEFRDRGWPFEVRVVKMSALKMDGAVPQAVANDTAHFVAVKTGSSRKAFSTKKDHYSHLWEERCAYCESVAKPHCEEMHPCSMNPKAISVL